MTHPNPGVARTRSNSIIHPLHSRNFQTQLYAHLISLRKPKHDAMAVDLRAITQFLATQSAAIAPARALALLKYE
jgi:hypothetical protein